MDKQLSLWHQFVETQNSGILKELFADDIKFHSPFVWKPKEGKQIAITIIKTVATVFDEFQYVREIIDGNLWALEFEAKIGELTLHGVDLIELNDEGKIADFEVMIRPANALQMLGREMTKRLSSL